LARDAEGRSPYAKALLHGNTEAATALLRHGAIDDLSPKDRFLAACACGDAEYVAQHPFDIGALSADDQRVLPHAASHGHIDAVRLMLSLGFDLRTPDEHGATALHHACWWGHAACAEALLRAGAPVDLEDPIYGGDALGWALHGAESSSGPRDGHPAVVRLLLEAGAVQSPGGCQSAHEGVQAVLTAWNTQA
ncbi:MAG TPA: ankyrin repeat domain-containing protein, partial [bacterium]|nr:ankyrin repeat domain-containing protein [bacterium]